MLNTVLLMFMGSSLQLGFGHCADGHPVLVMIWETPFGLIPLTEAIHTNA